MGGSGLRPPTGSSRGILGRGFLVGAYVPTTMTLALAAASVGQDLAPAARRKLAKLFRFEFAPDFQPGIHGHLVEFSLQGEEGLTPCNDLVRACIRVPEQSVQLFLLLSDRGSQLRAVFSEPALDFLYPLDLFLAQL